MALEDFDIEAELKKIKWTVPEDHLKAGRCIYYSDSRFPPELVVEEAPTGVKRLMKIEGTTLTAIRDL